MSRVDYESVPCDYCGAPAGRPCRTSTGGVKRDPHGVRIGRATAEHKARNLRLFWCSVHGWVPEASTRFDSGYGDRQCYVVDQVPSVGYGYVDVPCYELLGEEIVVPTPAGEEAGDAS